MNPLKKIISLAIALTAALCGAAQVNFDATAVKARRFFDNREWANASALYTIMLHERPDSPSLYGRAIVVTSILNDTVRSQDLLRQALKYSVPLDSVMSDVRKYSFIAKQPKLYENFLQRAARDNPWMKRALDVQLLRYYTYRSDAPQMEKYALLLLKGSPDNVSFLLILAQSYMLQDLPGKAVEIWQTIVEKHPDNYDAVISLANYYALSGQTDKALQFYTAAYDLRPTPYVQAAIERLTP